MQRFDFQEDPSLSLAKCPQCQGHVVDAGDEFACSSCGVVVMAKVVPEVKAQGMRGLRSLTRAPNIYDYTSRSLGSCIGPERGEEDEEAATGGGGAVHGAGAFSKTTMGFEHLKRISDNAYADGEAEACLNYISKMVERVCEKLRLPKAVMAQAISVSKEMLEARRDGARFTRPAISAFSIVAACKMYGLATASVKDVVGVHQTLGYRVTMRSFFRVLREAPVRLEPSKAEDFVARVASHLPEFAQVQVSPAYQRRLVDIARRILKLIDSPTRGGHSPSGMAATAVYAADAFLTEVEGRRRKALRDVDVARCVGLAEYTVREQYCQIFRPRMREMTASLCEQLHILLPREEGVPA